MGAGGGRTDEVSVPRRAAPVIEVERLQRKIVGVLSGTQVLGGAGTTTGLAISTLVAASISGSDAIGGLAQTSAVLGAAILALPAARLAARRGRRPALLLGYAVGTVGALVASVAVAAHSWPVLLCGLVMFGGGSAANLAGRYAATDLAHPRRRARSLSFVVWATTVGAVAGPNLADPAGRFAAAHGLPLGSGPFLLSAIVFGAASLGVFLGLRPDPLVVARAAELGREQPRLAADHCTGGATPTAVRATAWRSLRPSARLALAGVTLCHTAMVGMMSMTPVHMNHAGASLKVVGLVISLHVAAMYGASPLFGWMADRLGRVPVLAMGAALVVAAAGVAGMAPAADAPQLAAGLILLGFGWSAGVVSGSALLTESVPIEARPAAQGLSDLCMNVGGALGGVLAGIVLTTWSYAVLGLAVGFTALPLLVLCLFATLRPAT
ncbi:MFS transporter [Solihabitans fulvus]|uniref:MFS transporter n=1 Tax=Solihabitans fulvus TaxID=1892852 RepID=A0A5B2WVS8_9PSEU|nr:MFS transporter [Solihabitans fulvus]KAA2254970.1 MFS transporter [Solihabitans fulvus]